LAEGSPAIHPSRRRSAARLDSGIRRTQSGGLRFATPELASKEVETMRHSGVFALVALLSMASYQVASQEARSSSKGESASVDQVWSREDEYGRYAEAGDIDAYKSLFHDKFIGWPCEQEHPQRKAGVGKWVRKVRDQKIEVTSEVTREGAEDFGDIVVVHYRVTEVDTYPDGHTEGVGEEFKITHTWMRTGDTWQIIGGMCASLLDGPKSLRPVPGQRRGRGRPIPRGSGRAESGGRGIRVSLDGPA